MNKKIVNITILISMSILLAYLVFAAISGTIVSPVSGWNNNYSILLNVTTNDYANVTFNTSAYATLTTLYLNETSGNITLNDTFLDEGNNTIYVYVTNASDGTDLDTQSVSNVAVDLSAPTWDQDLTNQTVEYGSNFSYDVNATDAGIGISSYFVNETTNFAIGASTGIITNNTVLSVANYSLNVSVNDSFNYVNSSVIIVTVQDTTAPTWNESLQNQTVEYGADFSYDVNASDLSNISTYFINDTTNFAINSTTGLITNNTNLSTTTYWLNISVNDTYNNLLSQDIKITVNDSTAPTVSSTSPSGTVTSGSVTLSATTDENAVCRYETTDINYTNMTGNFTGTTTAHTASLSLSNGDYVYYIRCNDSSGNVMTTSANATFTVSITTTGGGGGSRTPTVRIYEEEINEIDLEFEEGTISQMMTVNDIGKFYIGSMAHEIKITGIKEDYIVINLQSIAHSFTLAEGQSKKFNIDYNPFNYDIEVTLNKISEGYADITLKEIDETITDEEEIKEEIAIVEEKMKEEMEKIEEEPKIEQEVSPITGAAVTDIGIEPDMQYIIISIGIVAIIGLLAVYYTKSMKPKKRFQKK